MFVVIAVVGCALPANAEERFPHPEFETEYTVPATAIDQYAPAMPPSVDILALVLALGIAAYLVLYVRKRKWVFVLMLAALVYFGFTRRGCVCPVGSLQNMSVALLTAGGAVTLLVLIFFILPLVMTLFTGRTFCSSVCPLGGIQDLVIVKPLHLPRWLREGLGLFRYFWLAFTVLLAVTGAGYFICRFDPFVGFFRMRMSVDFLVYGILILGIGTVIARPYCRFMCPYGVLLGWFSRLSFKHLTTTPDDCVECGLCPQSCPFDAIEQPEPLPAVRDREKRLRRLARVLIAAPLLLVAGAVCGYLLAAPVARIHPVLKLVRQLQAEDATGAALTEESKAFRMSGQPVAELYTEAGTVSHRIMIGMVLVGLFMALVIVIKLSRTVIIKEHTDYYPDKGNCFSCGRCVEVCPKEHQSRIADNSD